MRLGSLELGRIFLAPLSGIADSPYRRICKRFGADAVYTEMVSSEGLSRENPRSLELMKFDEEERPIGIQLFGRDPERMAASARQVERLEPDLIDLNLACPARRIVTRGEGCALMREPEMAGRVALAVVEAVQLPVTAKIRMGWDDESINAGEVVKVLEDAGVSAVAVHGRTYKQGFKGVAAWEKIAEVKRAARIPIILSGDVTSPETAEQAFRETGCDAIMIGRAVYGRPWLFKAIKAHLERGDLAGAESEGRDFEHGVRGGADSAGGDSDGGDSDAGGFAEPGFGEIRKVILDHVDLAIDAFGEETALMRFRKHLLWYTKGMPGVVALRPAVSRVSTRKQVEEMLDRLSANLENLGSSEAMDGKR